MKKTFTRFLSCMLVIAIVVSLCATSVFAATTSNEETQREIDNKNFTYTAATQGMVLLENNGTLPVAKTGKVALFGGGVRHTIKGGTGSGDVNQRAIVNVEQGFINAGYEITSGDYLDAFDVKYEEGTGGGGGGMWGSPFVDDLELTDEMLNSAAGADYAFYVVYRNSGEGSDRTATKGDYELSDVEYANIQKISAKFDKTIVVLNIGGVMDTKFFKEIDGLDAMLLMSQGGMRGGDAVVAVLNGTVNPSGHLTDTWPVNYSDYPSAVDFSSNDGNTNEEYYSDDIYVGYRYFDTFGKEVAYPFGYGSSYTTFEVKPGTVTVADGKVTVTATVKNTGKVAGKEVVQVYFSAPAGELEKPYQELAGYAKTAELAPGASETLAISYNLTEMSSYSMAKAAYILEKGDYVIRVGDNSRNTNVAAVLTLDETKTTEQLSTQMKQDKQFDVLSNKGATPITYAGEADQIAAAKEKAINITALVPATENNASPYDEEKITSYVYEGSTYTKAEGTRWTNTLSGGNNKTVPPVKVFDSAEGKETVETIARPEGVEAGKYTLLDVATGKITMTQLVADLSIEEMANIVEGVGWSAPTSPIIGAQSNSVNGAAGETTSLYYETRAIPNNVYSDGPAGIRITQHYTKDENGETVDYYQFATAFPIGTLIAMTWDADIIREFGERIGQEMTEFGVTLWLAPGMNIHRNPLCGRNFEYYSEDPLVAGLTAAYATLGVQSHPGVGVTCKHFAVNNQENNRNAVNNHVTERALREIYLKGFEIAVKMAQPMALMSSYNQNNGMPDADDYDLLTDITRGEWGFKGLVMTDWGGGQMTPANGMHSGNDMIQPGGSSQSIIDQFTTTPPTFDETTGYVKSEHVEIFPGFGWDVESWGEFQLAADGKYEEKVTVDASVNPAANEKVAACVEAGTATVSEAVDGKITVTYKGNYADNALPLGDLQKATANVLNVIMNTTQFEKLTKELNAVDSKSPVISVKPWSTMYDLKSYVDAGYSDYPDVAATAWYAPYVHEATVLGIMNGSDDGTFKPSANIKRGDLVLMLYRMADEPDVSAETMAFTDVEKSYYADAIKWAGKEGIVNGYEDKTFKPEKPMSREQIATVLYRMAGEPAVTGTLSYPDSSAVHEYAVKAMTWAVDNGVINGVENTTTHVTTLNPGASATRAQIATLIVRSLDLI